jgi:hypothetical protein
VVVERDCDCHQLSPSRQVAHKDLHRVISTYCGDILWATAPETFVKRSGPGGRQIPAAYLEGSPLAMAPIPSVDGSTIRRGLPR